MDNGKLIHDTDWLTAAGRRRDITKLTTWLSIKAGPQNTQGKAGPHAQQQTQSPQAGPHSKTAAPQHTQDRQRTQSPRLRSDAIRIARVLSRAIQRYSKAYPDTFTDDQLATARNVTTNLDETDGLFEQQNPQGSPDWWMQEARERDFTKLVTLLSTQNSLQHTQNPQGTATAPQQNAQASPQAQTNPNQVLPQGQRRPLRPTVITRFPYDFTTPVSTNQSAISTISTPISQQMDWSPQYQQQQQHQQQLQQQQQYQQQQQRSPTQSIPDYQLDRRSPTPYSQQPQQQVPQLPQPMPQQPMPWQTMPQQTTPQQTTPQQMPQQMPQPMPPQTMPPQTMLPQTMPQMMPKTMPPQMIPYQPAPVYFQHS